MKKLFKALYIARELAGLAWCLGHDVLDAVRGKRPSSVEDARGYDSL